MKDWQIIKNKNILFEMFLRIFFQSLFIKLKFYGLMVIYNYFIKKLYLKIVVLDKFVEVINIVICILIVDYESF